MTTGDYPPPNPPDPNFPPPSPSGYPPPPGGYPPPPPGYGPPTGYPIPQYGQSGGYPPPSPQYGAGQPGGLGVRFAARVIDGILVGIVSVVLALIFGLQSNILVTGLFSGLLMFIYFVALEVSQGASLGKKILGLSVRGAGAFPVHACPQGNGISYAVSGAAAAAEAVASTAPTARSAVAGRRRGSLM